MSGKRLLNGILGGLAGGVAFGAIMGVMKMLPMVGQIIGVPNAGVGFAVHMIISAAIGAGFALLFDRRVVGGYSGLIAGTLYGAVWWIVGPLTLMPLFLGMGFGVNWSAAAISVAFPSLVGHLIYGAILGITYSALHAEPTTEHVPVSTH